MKKKCDECRTKEKGEQPKHDPILEREGGIYLWFRVAIMSFVSAQLIGEGAKKRNLTKTSVAVC